MKLELFQVRTKHDEKIEIHYKDRSPLVERIISEVDQQKLKRHMTGTNDKGDKEMFETSAVLYFEAVDKRVFAYLEHSVYQVQQSLNALKDLLEDDGFIRINKSVIINIYMIETIKPELNMRVRAVLKNGEYLLINRSYKKSFENYLKERMNIV